MTIEQIFEEAKMVEEVKLAGGDRLVKLELQPHVLLLAGFDGQGRPWDSTMHTVDFALDDEEHSETATKKMLKALGMRGLKDFFLAYSVKREQLMGRFKR